MPTPDTNEELSDEQHRGTVGQRAGRRARANEYHVGEHQLLSAKTICHWSTKSGSKDSTKHKTCADETDHIGREMKLSDDEWHRHAEDENDETVKQRTTGREHPKPSLDRLRWRVVQQQRQALR